MQIMRCRILTCLNYANLVFINLNSCLLKQHTNLQSIKNTVRFIFPSIAIYFMGINSFIASSSDLRLIYMNRKKMSFRLPS